MNLCGFQTATLGLSSQENIEAFFALLVIIKASYSPMLMFSTSGIRLDRRWAGLIAKTLKAIERYEQHEQTPLRKIPSWTISEALRDCSPDRIADDAAQMLMVPWSEMMSS